MKKLLISLFVCLMICLLVACTNQISDSTSDQQAEVAQEAVVTKVKVGVSMPTKDLQRWNQDGDNMKKQLEAAGYEVDLQYANNDISLQVNQIENMIANDVSILVVLAIDVNSLQQPLALAKEKSIPVIAYDRLPMDTDAITYYVTFDSHLIGRMQGEYIKNVLELDNTDGPYNMEIFAGDMGDNNCAYLYDGAMEILKPYIEEGKIIIPSREIERRVVSTANWDTKIAQDRMQNLLSKYYADLEKLDIVLCANDSIALGVENALVVNYDGEYPIITGQDCDVANTKNIVNGKQAMSIFKDSRDLANQVVKMVQAVLCGEQPEINDTSTYDNGAKVVPSYLCSPVVVTRDNYIEMLIDSGHYTESQIK